MAEPGDDILGPHVRFALAPGVYSIASATVDADERTRLLVHRLARRLT